MERVTTYLKSFLFDPQTGSFRIHPMTYLYSSTFLAVFFSLLTNLAWGRWVPLEEFNAIQLVIRYAGIIGFLALPGMNEAASLAAGKGKIRTALNCLWFRFGFYIGIVSLIYFGMTGLRHSLIPGLNLKELGYIFWYGPVILVPGFILGVTLALGHHKWFAISRVANSALSALILWGFFVFGLRSHVAQPYLVLSGILYTVCLLPFFFLKTPTSHIHDKTLVRFGMDSSVIRWPEFMLSFEVAIVAMFLKPIELSIFFLSDRLCDHLKGLLSNNFVESYSQYARMDNPDDILPAADKECKRWSKNLWYYSLLILLIIPLGLVIWRREYWMAIPVAMAFSLVVLLGTPKTIVRQALLALKKRPYMAAHSTVYPIIYISVLFIFVKFMGLTGVVLARFIGMGVGVGIITYFGKKYRTFEQNKG